MATATVEAPPQVKEAPKPIFRKDYKPAPYSIDTVHLDFHFDEDATKVLSKLRMKPAYSGTEPPPLFLHGRSDVKLVAVKVNGQAVPESKYQLTSKSLTLKELPVGDFDLEITTEIKPHENSLLEGLYKSSGNYCTQCEAEGFRGITFFLDRPDVMAKYTTRMEADKKLYPVLLGNGNLIEKGDLENGRHYAVWEDPFPKPCYLFALVAGNLSMRERSFTTSSGRKVVLRIFTPEKDIHQVDFAMESLIKSMKWDEDTFGLEYDLDLFNIVAVDDFNMGAMENKSLNIFNSRLVLASPSTTTDMEYQRIEGVVGHEYFHNWTGNRVTCRDWFQLTLKEGLTVYRDQEFTADMNSRPVKRIEDVMMLRSSQFSEDAGAMAHPIRPDSYIKMDNFYTRTVYEKGAEVVRLYATLLGKEGFRKGMDLYFKRHDGQAVTCDDFLAAMADANDVDLSGLAKWYGQAGTPHLTVSTEYNPTEQTFTLKTRQHTPATSGQPDKLPVLIPLKVGLLGPDGHDLPLRLKGQSEDLGTTTVLRVDQAEQEFVFTHVPCQPVASLLRDFSAPVKMTVEGQTDDDLVFMFANDSDPFNRWEAGQRLAKKLLLKLYAAAASNSNGTVEERCLAAGGVQDNLVEAFRSVLTDKELDGAFMAMAVTLPSGTELLEDIPGGADPVLVHDVRLFVVKQLAARLRPELEAVLKANDDAPGAEYTFDAASAARRAIKNKALVILSTLEDPDITKECLKRFREATNMTDQFSALAALVEISGPERDQALQEFSKLYQDQPLIMLKWLGIQAMSNAPGNLLLVRSLLEHPSFVITTPNCCYSLLLGFTRSPVNFHAADGSGYQFMADMVMKVDQINHQVAARMVSCFTTFKRLDDSRQQLVKQQLSRLASTNGLSENVFEIVQKSLDQ